MGRYRTAAHVVALGALLTYLYYPVLVDLEAQWAIDTTFGYGYYIPGVAAYLVWERRRRLMSAAAGASWWGYGVLVLGLGLVLAGRAGGVQLLSRLSLIAVLVGLSLFLGGWQRMKVLAFPIAFLALMIPPPASVLSRMTWPLQLFTARFATEALRLIGLPVLLRGVFIDLPTVRVEVAEACSGFRSLIALGATGVLLAYMTQPRWVGRLLVVAAVVPIAVIANAVRVTWIIVMGTFDPRFFESALHPGSGLVVFAISTALLIGLSALLSRRITLDTRRVGGAPA